MRMQRMGSLATCLAILLMACEPPQTDTGDGHAVDQQEARQAIEEQNARFERYVENQQFDSLATLYTAGGQLMAPNAPAASGENLISAFEGMAGMGVGSVDLQTSEVEAAEEFAYEVGTYSLRGEDGSEIDDGKYIVIWRVEDGEWKLHRDIFNSNRPAPGQEPGAQQPGAQSGQTPGQTPPGQTQPGQTQPGQTQPGQTQPDTLQP